VDAGQFKQSMLAFQAQHQQFLGRVLSLQAPSTSTEQSSGNPASVNPALLQPFENFDSKKRNFSSTIANDLKTFLK
jgi:hypothetical protein